MADEKSVQFRRGTLEQYEAARETSKCDCNDIYIIGDSSEVSDPDNPLRIYIGENPVHTISTEDITVGDTTFKKGTSLEKIIKGLASSDGDSQVTITEEITVGDVTFPAGTPIEDVLVAIANNNDSPGGGGGGDLTWGKI